MRSRRRFFSRIGWILIAIVAAGSHVLVPFAASAQPMPLRQQSYNYNIHSFSDAGNEMHSPSDLEEPLVNDLNLKMTRPTITEIGSWEKLTEWYQDAVDSGKEAFGKLTEDIYVDGSWSMEASGNYITLETGDFTIKVPEGASFTMDNPRLYLVGAGPVLQVMMGGEAALMRGTLQSFSPRGIAVISYAPANLTIGEAASVGTILYLNDGTEGIPPQSMEREILNVFDSPAVSMTAGEPPLLPETAGLQAMSPSAGSGSHEKLWVPIQWQTEGIDFDVPGEKLISGVFTEGVLKERKLTNPKHLTGSIRVLVQEPGPIQQFSGRIMNINGSGDNRIAALRFELPLLSKDVTGVYLEQSLDGVWWSRVDNSMGTEADPKNFLEQIHWAETKGYLVYYAPIQGEKLWFRLDIQGSVQEGKSNPVTLAVPVPGEKPGNDQEGEEEEDDGSSGGNRGGIGQEESDRVMPDRDESGSGLFPGGVFSDKKTLEAGKHMVSPIPVYAAETETTKAVQPPEREEEKTEETQVRRLAENETTEPMQAEPAGVEPAGMELTAVEPAEQTRSEPVAEPAAAKPAYPPSTGAAVAAICAAAGVLGFWLFRKKGN